MFALLTLLRTQVTHAHTAASHSAKKTASYALMHLIIAMAVAYLLTGDWRAALAIGLVEPVVQTFAYTLHERFWAKAETASAQREAGPGAAHQGAAAP